MAHLFRDRLGESNRHSRRVSSIPKTLSLDLQLPSPFGELSVPITPHDLRETSFEIFSAVCRTSGASKPLSYIPFNTLEKSPSNLSNSPSSIISDSLQRSLTSTAAIRMKKALGFKNLRKSLESSDEKGSSNGRKKKYKTVGELVRVQMGVSEQVESRIRRGLLRIAASQMGRRVESMVLPLELLQQFKPSDFQDQQEYNLWQIRNLKILEEGLLMHPLVPLQKSDLAAQRLRQIIRMAADTPLDTGKNSESMQVLRNSVTTLASRSSDGYTSETCHWADSCPLNLHLYQMLLETCFNSEEGSIIEEIDEVLETIKKTWVVLGINQKLHNLIFLWITFQKFVTTGQVDADLLCAADSQLGEIVIDAKSTKDSTYSKVLSSTLSAIMGWAEKRLLAYHDTFNPSNIELMERIVSLGVSSAKVLMEGVSNEYRRPRREETDVAKSRVDTYIRSSVRTAFAQKMEQADISRRSKDHSTPTPLLAILAKDAGELANKEKKYFSPILKNWHPLAAGVAAATLHSCYGNELKQFLSGITELTIDSVQVMRAADKLEKDLVFIAVEDSVDSEDGGKALIREMPPYDAESAISDLVKKWIQTKVDRLKECLQDSKSINYLDVFNHWAENFDSDPRYPMCPQLKEKVEYLVCKLLNKKASAGNCLKRKFDGDLVDMLESLKFVAINVCNDQIGAHQEWKNKIIKTRMALYLGEADVSNAEEFPFRKKQKTRKFLSATNSGVNSSPTSLLNERVRRSQRKLLNIGSCEILRKRIPVGPSFQADIPDWMGPAQSKDALKDSRWMGTQIWPVECDNRRTSKEIIGKGRELSCNCTFQGSVECIRYHVSMARLRLKSDLGSSFNDLGFNDMGEEISKTWTQEEQVKFDDIVRQYPLTEGKTFLRPALEYFTSKSRKDIVSFYYNVFVLRWMSIRTRQGTPIVDSSDDEAMVWG